MKHGHSNLNLIATVTAYAYCKWPVVSNRCLTWLQGIVPLVLRCIHKYNNIMIPAYKLVLIWQAYPSYNKFAVCQPLLSLWSCKCTFIVRFPPMLVYLNYVGTAEHCNCCPPAASLAIKCMIHRGGCVPCTWQHNGKGHDTLKWYVKYWYDKKKCIPMCDGHTLSMHLTYKLMPRFQYTVLHAKLIFTHYMQWIANKQ